MSSSQTDELHRRRRRIKAILAVGIILGLGAVATLAAYTSSVFGQATFATGKFNVLGSFDGGTNWSSSNATKETAGTLNFQVNPGAMTPGDTVYAPIALKVDPDKNGFDGDAVLEGAEIATPNMLSSSLRYVVKSLPYASCNAGGFSGGAVPPGFPNDVPLTDGSTGTPLRLSKNSTPVELCFAVTLPGTYAANQDIQGLSTGKVTWGFEVSSVPA